MSATKKFKPSYPQKIAYPTILLTIIAAGIYVLSTMAAIEGMLAFGWAITINVIMSYLLFTSMHEAGHYNVSGNVKSAKWLDEVVGWISGIPLLAPFYVFRIIHFRHHAFTNDPEKDPDHWLASKSLIGLIFHSTTIFPVYLVKATQLLKQEKRISSKMKKDLRIGFVGFTAMIIALFLLGMAIGWAVVISLWVLPALIAQTLLAFAFDWLPHHPHEEQGKYLNSRIIDIPFLSIFFLGQNYHLIHHLHPRIPFYDYQKTFVQMEDELNKEGTEILGLEQHNKELKKI